MKRHHWPFEGRRRLAEAVVLALAGTELTCHRAVPIMLWFGFVTKAVLIPPTFWLLLSSDYLPQFFQSPLGYHSQGFFTVHLLQVCIEDHKWVQTYLWGLITKSIISHKILMKCFYCDPRHFQKRVACCYFYWLQQSLQQSHKKIHMLRQLPDLFFFPYLEIYFLCMRSSTYCRELTLTFCCIWCWTTHQSKRWFLCTDWNDQTRNRYKDLTDLIKCLLLKWCQ